MLSKKKIREDSAPVDGVVFDCDRCNGSFFVASYRLKGGGGDLQVGWCPFCGALADICTPEDTSEDNSIPARIKRFIEDLLTDKPKFHGSVQANFSIGGLTNVNVNESTRGKDVR